MLPRQRLPDRAGGPALAQRGQELLAAAVGGPGCGVDGLDGKRRRLGAVCFSTLAWRGGTASRSTSARVPA